MAPPPTCTSQDPVSSSSAFPAAETSPATASASASAVGSVLRTPNYGYLAASAAFIGASLVGAKYMEAKALKYDPTKIVPMSRTRATAIAVVAGSSMRGVGIYEGSDWKEDMFLGTAFALGFAAFQGQQIIRRTAFEVAGFGVAIYATDAAYNYFKERYPVTKDTAQDNAQGVTGSR